MQSVHAGHRSRMKAKLYRYGSDIFETHELLEMLLYLVIPYKDTNPLAHELLKRFGSLDGLFAAGEEALCGVSGIGTRTAHFLTEVGACGEEGLFFLPIAPTLSFSEVDAGEYVHVRLSPKREHETLLLSLDNRMHLIAADSLSEGEFGKGDTACRALVSLAMERHASAVVIAHNHPYGPLFPTENDMVRNAFLEKALALASVTLKEHYVVSGEHLTPISSLAAGHCALHALPILIEKEEHRETARQRERTLLSRFLSLLYPAEQAEKTAERLLSEGASLHRLLTLPQGAALEETELFLFRLTACLAGRRHTDRLAVAPSLTESVLIDGLAGYFAPLAEECVYLLLLDGEERLLSCHCVSRGSLNASGIVPRRLVDLARRGGARSVILAHNHPDGFSRPSAEDIRLTSVMKEAFSAVGIFLREHYVIASDGFSRVSESRDLPVGQDLRFASSLGNKENGTF